MTDSHDAPLKQTPLNAVHREMGARMTPFGGWDMPLHYGSQLNEHHAVRNTVGIFDVSHMGQVRFRGARTLELLQLLVPGNVGRLVDGGSIYTQLTTPTGGMVDDLIITRLAPDHYFAVVNASTREGDIKWMLEQKHALGFHDVHLEDESDRWAMIALQGPIALDVANKALPQKDWRTTKAFTMWPITVDGKDYLVSRTGYTGENGIELLCPPAEAPRWWRRFHELGAAPIGLGARDSLRLEMGYSLYGQDIDLTTSPVEAGLSWTVGWKKTENYLGRDIIEGHKANKPPRVLIALRTDSRRPIRHGDKVVLGDKEVGVVTSGGFSPTLSCGIALAYVKRDAAEGQTAFGILSREVIPATVCKLPFVKVKSVPVT